MSKHTPEPYEDETLEFPDHTIADRSGHTPGPWKIDDALDLPLAVIRDHEDGEGIAELGEYTPENEANARLIAAAPQMLALLRRAYQQGVFFINQSVEEDENCLACEVAALITKIEGRTEK